MLTLLLTSVHPPGAKTVLARDIDKRSLPAVTQGSLSPAMTRAIAAFVAGNGSPAEVSISRIAVHPKNHRLYQVDLQGSAVCADNVLNCPVAVFDETPQGVDTLFSDAGLVVLVIRRPALAMPDIALRVQEGHAAIETTVYRFDGTAWHTFRCKEASLVTGDPHPEIIADQPCHP